ncbi:MAG: hypothetical protein JWO19_1626 [Bryobacterales bacterium]|nr:hypothetical protein [Bryobacterales bacterium]
MLTSERTGVDVSQSESEGIDSYVKQLSEIDPQAQAFRYPRDKRGNASLDKAPEYINIAVFAEHMEQLCTSLDALDSYFDHELDVKSEMASDGY